MFKWLKGLFIKEQKVLEKFNTSEVFKISGLPKHTFVERSSLNEKISDFFVSKDRVLLFLGYSKSGKTVYRKKHLDKEGFKIITFRCNSDKTIVDLYNQIASECNLGQIISSNNSISVGSSASSSAGVSVPAVGNIDATITSDISYSYAKTEEQATVKIDVNFLCNKLKENNVLVILEDYHLASSELNKTLSEDIKHFLDDEILFLLIGIPSSPNRALRNNPDLSGRMEHLNFDYLSKDEINKIINDGTKILNVEFNTDVRDAIVKYSMKNAFLVQYICRELLNKKSIKSTSTSKIKFTQANEVEDACRAIASRLDNDYSDIYSIITSGIRRQQENKAFNQYEEVLKALKHFEIDELEKGVHHTKISQMAWNKIPAADIQKYIDNGTYKSETSFKGSLTTQVKNAVDNINTSLSKKNTRPVLYVDDRNIYLTDLVFKFYLNWKEDAV